MLKDLIRTAQRAWFDQRRIGLRQRIQREYGHSQDSEVREVIEFLGNHPDLSLPTGMTPPYDWAKDFRPEDVRVEKDPESEFLRTTINGHPVFFPRKTTPAQMQLAVNIGLMEQDPRSPHCYLGNGFDVDAGDIGVFIGASDGLFCLSLIDRLSKAYLFEPCADWHEPLRATFAPWGDKVEIVPFAAGSKDGAGQVSLDRFFETKPLPNYIQIDVDGVEADVLQGARNLLRSADKLRLSICTYHKRLDFDTFQKLLGAAGYAVHHSPGFFFIGVRMPYFRRGVLYASKGVSIDAPPGC